MVERADWSDVWLGVAAAVATRSSCVRSQVGAVVVYDNIETFVGYNGPKSGELNCDEGGCARGKLSAEQLPSGAPFNGVGACCAVHAEVNAVVKYLKLHISVRPKAMLYSTREPCELCWAYLYRVGFGSHQVHWGAPRA